MCTAFYFKKGLNNQTFVNISNMNRLTINQLLRETY
ncbi:Uncharacterised protein [Klebsiella quasipneumoniae]|nr:Uncharacterised protein [Klebsiella quasipneumoniae]